jgi:hypothetical protein
LVLLALSSAQQLVLWGMTLLGTTPKVLLAEMAWLALRRPRA